jgi:hypothetical protein
MMIGKMIGEHRLGKPGKISNQTLGIHELTHLSVKKTIRVTPSRLPLERPIKNQKKYEDENNLEPHGTFHTPKDYSFHTHLSLDSQRALRPYSFSMRMSCGFPPR